MRLMPAGLAFCGFSGRLPAGTRYLPNYGSNSHSNSNSNSYSGIHSNPQPNPDMDANANPDAHASTDCLDNTHRTSYPYRGHGY